MTVVINLNGPIHIIRSSNWGNMSNFSCYLAELFYFQTLRMPGLPFRYLYAKVVNKIWQLINIWPVQFSRLFLCSQMLICYWGSRPWLCPWHVKGSRLRIACCLLLPAIQLIAGISYPSWISLPYFIASCVGLVDWSLTSNFLGLFRLCCRIKDHLSFTRWLACAGFPVPLIELFLWLLKVVEGSSSVCRLQSCPALCISASCRHTRIWMGCWFHRFI